jgi:hypothetical protein
VSDLLTGRADEVGAGFVLGIAATLACLAVVAWWRRRRPGEPAPVAGVALATAGAAGIALTTGRPATLALPAPVLVVVAGLAGLLLADFDRRWRRRGLAPMLLAVSAGGIWAAVPDVEVALVVLGVTIPITLLGWPSPLVRSGPPPSLGAVGALAVAGLFTWTAAAGAAGRPAAVAGGLVCLGVLVVEPVVNRLDPRRRSPLDPTARRAGPAWMALGAQLVLVGLASRVVVRPERAATALLLAALELGLAVVAGIALARRPAAGRRTAP